MRPRPRGLGIAPPAPRQIHRRCGCVHVDSGGRPMARSSTLSQSMAPVPPHIFARLHAAARARTRDGVRWQGRSPATCPWAPPPPPRPLGLFRGPSCADVGLCPPTNISVTRTRARGRGMVFVGRVGPVRPAHVRSPPPFGWIRGPSCAGIGLCPPPNKYFGNAAARARTWTALDASIDLSLPDNGLGP